MEQGFLEVLFGFCEIFVEEFPGLAATVALKKYLAASGGAPATEPLFELPGDIRYPAIAHAVESGDDCGRFAGPSFLFIEELQFWLAGRPYSRFF